MSDKRVMALVGNRNARFALKNDGRLSVKCPNSDASKAFEPLSLMLATLSASNVAESQQKTA
jgi:hypothetical protein